MTVATIRCYCRAKLGTLDPKTGQVRFEASAADAYETFIHARNKKSMGKTRNFMAKRNAERPWEPDETMLEVINSQTPPISLYDYFENVLDLSETSYIAFACSCQLSGQLLLPEDMMVVISRADLVVRGKTCNLAGLDRYDGTEFARHLTSHPRELPDAATKLRRRHLAMAHYHLFRVEKRLTKYPQQDEAIRLHRHHRDSAKTAKDADLQARHLGIALYYSEMIKLDFWPDETGDFSHNETEDLVDDINDPWSQIT